MDDKTRGVGDRDDMAGRADETTRNLGSTATPPATKPASTRGSSAGSRSTAASRRTTTTDDDLDRETEMRTRELQAEISDTREEMSETIEAIQARLKPSNIVSNATDAVKTATTEKVRHMADTASDTASDMVRQTRRTAADVVEGARRNPIPALMIGTGVAWLLMDRSRNEGRQVRYQTRGSGWSPYTTPSRGAYDRTSAGYDRTGGAYRNTVGTGVNLDDDVEYSDVEYRGGEYRGGSGSGSASASGSIRGVAGDMTSRASNAAEDARMALSRTTRNAQNGLQRMLHENPLLVGAAAVLVGAAVGAALPETERENELMGETRDSVVDKAQDMARNAASTVQEVATDAAKEVTDRVTSNDK